MTQLKFGKYKGEMLSAVPTDYLTWLSDREWLQDDLLGAVLDELAARKERQRTAPPLPGGWQEAVHGSMQGKAPPTSPARFMAWLKEHGHAHWSVLVESAFRQEVDAKVLHAIRHRGCEQHEVFITDTGLDPNQLEQRQPTSKVAAPRAQANLATATKQVAPAGWTGWVRIKPGPWRALVEGKDWSEATDRLDDALARQPGRHSESVVLQTGEHPDDRRRQLAAVRQRRKAELEARRRSSRPETVSTSHQRGDCS